MAKGEGGVIKKEKKKKNNQLLVDISVYDTRTVVTPRVNIDKFGERSFSYAGPSVWNNLPQTLRHSDSASCFKAALKTHLFNNYL